MTANQDKNITTIKRVQLAFGLITAIIVLIVFLVMNSESGINSKLKKEVTSEMDNIQVHLQNYFDDNGAYPAPDEGVSILAGKGNFIYFQGNLGKTVQELISLDNKVQFEYTYSVTHSRDKYQLVYFDDKNNILSAGDKIGVFVNSKHIPFQNVDYALGDITKTEESYTVYLDDNLKITGGANDMKTIKAIAAYDYDESLLAYYDMETLSDSGKLFDLSGNKNHGSLNGDVEIGAVQRGKHGSATLFDGKDDYINIDSLSKQLALVSDFSVTYSFKTEANFDGYIPLISANSNSDIENIFRLGIQPENKFFFTIGNFDKKRLYFNGDLADGKWHSVSFVYNSNDNTITVFIDGVLRKTMETDEESLEMFRKVSALSIAQEYDLDENGEFKASDFFEGEIDEIFFHSRALTLEDVKKFHNKK